MQKPRSDAILLNLPEHQQSQLAEWLLSGMTYTMNYIQKSRDLDIVEAKLKMERRKVEFLEAQEYERTHPKPRPDYTKPLTPEQRAYMVKFVEKKMGLKAAPYTPEVIKAMPKYYQDLFNNTPAPDGDHKKPGDASEGHDPQMMKNDKL